jgi:hypothetical protein
LNGGNPSGERCDGTLDVSVLQVSDGGSDIGEVTLEHSDAFGVGEVVNLVEFGGEPRDEFGNALLLERCSLSESNSN